MAILINVKNGTSKEVKNLGWLLRNYNKVKRFEVVELLHNKAILTAYCDNDLQYECHFESLLVCQNWLTSHKRIFNGLPLEFILRGQMGAYIYRDYSYLLK
jgi:hypothetical protein